MTAVDTTSIEDPQERRVVYNRMVREARLISISLKSIDFKVTQGLPPQAERQMVYDRRLSEFFYIREDNAIVCDAEWIVEIRKKRKRIAKCRVSYRAFYDSFSPVPDDIARLYAENQVLPATYAYFRALYASLDWAAGFASPPLPIIKFLPKI